MQVWREGVGSSPLLNGERVAHWFLSWMLSSLSPVHGEVCLGTASGGGGGKTSD